MKCPDCGSAMKLIDDTWICQYCGTEVEDERVKKVHIKKQISQRVDVYNHYDDDDDSDDEREKRRVEENKSDNKLIAFIIAAPFVFILCYYLISSVFGK